MTRINLPCVLTIAGTDPSGGAGIQADIKSISANGGYAASVITALVAQNTLGVKSIHDISHDFFREQLEAVFDDLEIAAIKIGMLPSELMISTLANILKKRNVTNIVLDPVMVAKNGHPLVQEKIVHSLTKYLFRMVKLITPNLHEAELLLERKITTINEMELAAEELSRRFHINVLVKGGHLQSDWSSDVLCSNNCYELQWFHASRIDTKNTHGTGCTLSSAIAAYLARGFSLKNAITLSKSYLTKAIDSGSNLKIGKGFGPVNHFYFLEDLTSDI